MKLLTSGLILAALSLLTAQFSYSISGSLVDETGRAACGVRVCAFGQEFEPGKPGVFIPCAFTDAHGQFNMAVRHGGRYRLSYSGPSEDNLSPYMGFFRDPSIQVPEVFLDGSNVRASISMNMLPKNGVLAGKSVDATTGNPVEDAEFVLCHAEHPEVCWQSHAKNSDGSFRFPAPRVPFTLKVRAEGYKDWLGPEGEQPPFNVAPNTKWAFMVSLERTPGGRPLSDAEKKPGLYLPAPAQTAPADGVVFQTYPRVTRLEWTPVAGAVSYSIELDYCSGETRDRCIDPQPLKLPSYPAMSGINSTTYEFEFIGAQPGRWRVWAVDRDGREGFKSPWRRFVYTQ